MGYNQPFMYDSVPKETSKYPYSDFDPRAVSRASLAPKPVKPKQEGPLVSFNAHPDSYMQLPYGNINAVPMSKSTKARIVQTRWAQLAFRVLELLGAAGSVALFVMISGVPKAEAWVMRIAPGVAMLHDVYAIYHLSRKAADRTPGSTASYMAFAAAFDTILLPFYAFSAYESAIQWKLLESSTGTQWTTLLSQGQDLMTKLIAAAFLASTITGGLHLISLALSIYLFTAFRKITNLPPDMNPLESHLTARPHKRNKSELTSFSASSLAESEKRISLPLEGRRNSGAPYEDLSRPPAIPFLHTRSGSTESFGTYNSRDSRLDLPSRNYQIPPANTSTTSLPMKRASYNTSTPSASPTKQAAYSQISLDDRPLNQPLKEAWFKAETPSNADNPYPKFGGRSPSPKKTAGNYAPLQQDAMSADIGEAFPSSHPNPLRQNPSSGALQEREGHNRGNSYNPPKSPLQVQTQRQPRPQSYYGQSQSPSRSPVRDILASQPNAFQAVPKPRTQSPATTPTKVLPNPFIKSYRNSPTGSTATVNNKDFGRALTNLSETHKNIRSTSSSYSGDIVDASVSEVSSVSSYNRNSIINYNTKSQSTPTSLRIHDRDNGLSSVQERVSGYESHSNHNSPSSSPQRPNKRNVDTKQSFSFTSSVSALSTDDTAPPQSQALSKFKAKNYGDLRAATPPVMLGPGGDLGVGGRERQLSSGNDWSGRREVSGKVAEEGRGGNTWGTRFRRISGLGGAER